MPLNDLIPRNHLGIQTPWLGQDGPELPTLAPMASASLPSIPVGAMPSVVPQAPDMVINQPNLTDQRIQQSKVRLNDLINQPHLGQPGSTHPGILGKIGHIAAGIGNIAGNIVAPETMMLMPGTSLNKHMQIQQEQERLAQAEATKTEEGKQSQTEATTAYTQARPDIEQSKIEQKFAAVKLKADQMAANTGHKPAVDADGNVSYEVDPDSPYTKRLQAQTEVAEGQIANVHAQTALRDAQAAWEKAKLDPNSQAGKIAWGNLQARMIEARAASTRATTGVNQYMMRAYNKGANGEVLPGAPQITDDAGVGTTVGTANAAQAVKANANAGQFGDAIGAVGNVEAAAHNLVAKGGKLNSPGVAAALAHPPTQLREWLQGEGVKANLTPEEREYVTSIAAAHENVQALRKAAGGTATDSSVAKLDALIPGISTPDLDYLMRQTSQIRATASRLGRGVTTVHGGLSVPREAPAATAQPTRPANVPEGYIFKDGPKGKGWYRP